MTIAQRRRSSGVLFDVYGTLCNIDTLSHICGQVVDDPEAFLRLWRAKQLEYSFIRTLVDDYAEFGQVTWDALDYAAATYGVSLEHSDRRHLMHAWLTMPLHDDVRPALERLAQLPITRAVLSNGSRSMLQRLLTHHDLHGLLPHVFSSEAVQVYKPHPQVYLYAAEQLRMSPSELLLVSSNGFDLVGAAHAGLCVCRVNRAGLPLDPLGIEPDVAVESLGQLVDHLSMGRG